VFALKARRAGDLLSARSATRGYERLLRLCLGVLRRGALSTGATLLGLAAAGAHPSTNQPASAAVLQDGGRRLSLENAQRLAVERNWDLLAAAAGVNAASAQKIIAKEFPNPTLSFSSTLINVDHHSNSTADGNGFWDRSYDTVAAINQLLEIGGKRRNRKASAQAGFEEAKAQFQDAQRTLELGVTKAYVAAAQAEENVRVLNKSAATLRQEAHLADVRLRAGEISGSDRSQIEIGADRLELDAKAAESAAAQARVALEILLGDAHPKGQIELTDALETLCAAAPPIESESSCENRPDVAVAAAALRKADSDLHLQKANRIPDPTVLAQYEHEPPDNPNSVGFGVSFPLPLWNRNYGGIMAAEANREQARLALNKVEAQARADLATAHFAYDNAIQRWRRFQDSVRPHSEEIRKTMAYAYEKGGASILDLLAAERNDNEIRLAAAQAASDAAVALAGLTAATRQMK
jgi:cobalt-zinc-cadmium efflux system outer membrane protein